MKLGLQDMSLKARGGYYHDYLSPLDMPEHQLVNDLADMAQRRPDHRAAILSLRRDVINGVHDASKEEGEAWAESEEGQAAMRLLKGQK
jgi:hypothetical protein